MMSYELAGDDLKAHMGHKVEVMGTMSKKDMDSMAKSTRWTSQYPPNSTLTGTSRLLIGPPAAVLQ